MTRPTMSFEELEQVYDLLAKAVDSVGEAQAAVLLTKFALTLSHESGDIEMVRRALDTARRDLGGCPRIG
ncbi:MAG: hypothetical protein HOI95_04800 [Chromatiales bacterium]|jgi:hypothetical protein|nr:hypothetical protein [Chromatiales bacterium]